MGAIRLGILNCVLIGIIGASEVVTFAEKCLNAGQHMVIFDDNIKGMYIGRGSGDKKKRQVALKSSWLRVFFAHAYKMLVKHKLRIWGVAVSPNPLSNRDAMCWQDTHFSQSVKRGLLSPDFSKFMIYGAGFGILKGGGSFACSYGNLTDDFERSIRYVKKYRKSLTFPIIHLRKQVAAGGGDRQAVAAQSVREGLRMSLDLLKDSPMAIQKYVLDRCLKAKNFKYVAEVFEKERSRRSKKRKP